jgi:hypothetical protein
LSLLVVAVVVVATVQLMAVREVLAAIVLQWSVSLLVVEQVQNHVFL